jgi:hypothetical protein
VRFYINRRYVERYWAEEGVLETLGGGEPRVGTSWMRNNPMTSSECFTQGGVEREGKGAVEFIA